MRRIDRWTVHRFGPLLRTHEEPLVVDLGFGSTPVTVLELARYVHEVAPAAQIVGVELDPSRVAAARATAGTPSGIGFERGGFEWPLQQSAERGSDVVIVRAANVLRQYQEHEVHPAWQLLASGLAPDGWVIDATCDELGRVACWVALPAEAADRPASLTVSLRLRDLERPSVVAERLPKCLIHRNVPGQGIYEFLRALDRAWFRAAPLAAHGARQRWMAAVGSVRAEGWPVTDGPRRWRLGEVTIDYSAVDSSGDPSGAPSRQPPASTSSASTMR